MPRGMKRTLIAALALAGCTAAAPAPAPTAAPALAGSWWAIESIDGRALEAAPEDGRPYLALVKRSYSIYAGCNGMGGLYAYRGGRMYTLPGPQTAMACGGRRGEQEAVVNAVMYASPAVAGSGERLTLKAKGRTIALRRVEPPRQFDEVPEAWQGATLAGQAFELSRVDGDPLNRTPFPRLTFAAKTATLSHLCGRPQVLRYRQTSGGEVFLDGGPQSCLGGMFAGKTLSMVSGPNGELLLAGDGHWLGGDNIRRDRPK